MDMGWLSIHHCVNFLVINMSVLTTYSISSSPRGSANWFLTTCSISSSPRGSANWFLTTCSISSSPRGSANWCDSSITVVEHRTLVVLGSLPWVRCLFILYFIVDKKSKFPNTGQISTAIIVAVCKYLELDWWISDTLLVEYKYLLNSNFIRIHPFLYASQYFCLYNYTSYVFINYSTSDCFILHI